MASLRAKLLIFGLFLASASLVSCQDEGDDAGKDVGGVHGMIAPCPVVVSLVDLITCLLTSKLEVVLLCL